MTMTTTPVPAFAPDPDSRKRAYKLGLWGLLANWDTFGARSWVLELIECEEKERARRSLERRLRNAKLGRFKPMVDFDWTWPGEIDRDLIEELLRGDFIAEATNVLIVGPNGVGKTMIAKNLVHSAILAGHTARFVTASELLNDLAAQESPAALLRCLRRYTYPEVLAIDEVGYLATSSEHADLLFEVITRRYQEKSIVLTTNKAFAEWNEVFPNASCVVTMIDRLIHDSEIVTIKGHSYRLKEHREKAAQRKKKRSKRPRRKKP